ncbi:MAG: cytochrome C [Hyphomicrobiaceae bacterium]
MMRVIPTLISLVAVATWTVTVRADDAPAGASSCSGCHPRSARATTPVPSLAGRKAVDIEAEMAAFKSGARPSTIMSRLAKGFSEQEISAIAAWYEKQRR